MTRRGYVAGALVVLVLLVVPLGLGSLHTPAADRASSRPFVLDDSFAVQTLDCRVPVRLAPSLDLPSEPVGARLCTAAGDISWAPPMDLLRRTDDLALAIDDATPAGDDLRCFGNGGYGFDLRLVFEDDTAVSLRGNTGGCGFVEAADGWHVGAHDLLETFLDSLAEQRKTREPGRWFSSGGPSCPQGIESGHVPSLIGDPSEIVSAASCWYPVERSGGYYRGPIHIGSGRVARLVEDIEQNTETSAAVMGRPDCGGDELYVQEIVGWTRWCDTVIIPGLCHEFVAAPNGLGPLRTFGDPNELPYWHPSPGAQRILDGLRR